MFIELKELQEIDWVNPLDYVERNFYKDASLLTGNEEQSEFTIYGHNLITEFNSDNDSEVWDSLHELIEGHDFSRLPFPAKRCGWIGYLSYDMGRHIESFPSSTNESYHLPQARLRLYKHYVYWDNLRKKCWKIELKCETAEQQSIQAREGFSIGRIEQECTQQEYMDKVAKIQDYILSGNVYEVNLTQQFTSDFEGSSWGLFTSLYKKNPAPFSAFLNYEDMAVTSISPEGFLKCNNGQVLTKPIKGTAPRGKNLQEDLKNKQELFSSEKDLAELHMIVDLMRNDLSKVCRLGSVEVVDPNRLEVFANVFHLVGIVTGMLKIEYSMTDLIKACFPGGSITGCPKIASMKVIEELESYRRNIYTGSILLVNNCFLQSNIAIRTGIIKDNKLFVNSGGAVTIDSDPLAEYQEILHKIRTFLDL